MNDHGKTPILTRREFLKLSLLAGSTQLLPSGLAPSQTPPNILIVLFDSWTSSNLDIFGYPRSTMPNLSRLADRAIVYHNHYAGGNFTTPGTASLLTGTSPQTHRALSGNSRVIPSLANQNLFSLFASTGYHTIGYSHNNYANTLLYQFSEHLGEHIPRHSLFLNKSFLLNMLLDKDYDTAFLSQDQILVDTPANSLLLSKLYNLIHARNIDRILKDYKELFPAGVPDAGKGNYYLLEDAVDFIQANASIFTAPYLAYFHLIPPHSPYRPRRDFFDAFKKDGAEFPDKPEHLLTEQYTRKQMLDLRQRYDEFLLYVDAEIQRLIDSLQVSGALENTVLVLTSDHGEMFERGIVRHGKATLHEPVIRIPLFIFMPGQHTRIDITQTTSALDVLPTLLEIAGQPFPAAVEGAVLPPFAKTPLPAQRPFFIVHAPQTRQNQAVSDGTSMILKEGDKLTRYSGYPQLAPDSPLYEMYNLAEDPQEMSDLYTPENSRAVELIEELENMLAETNRPYED